MTTNTRDWKKVTFDDVFDIKGGSQPPKSEFVTTPRAGYIRLLQIRDFETDGKAVYIPISNRWPTCNRNDIMIGRYGASVGKILGGKEGAYNVALVKVLLEENRVSRAWARYFFQTDFFQGPIARVSRSAQNGFNKEDLSSIEFMLPPLDVQNRIAEKLGSFLARSTAARIELSRVAKLVERCKSALLEKACACDLTNGWRTSRKLPDPMLTTVGAVASDMSYGTSAKSSPEGSVPVLRMGNIQEGNLDWRDLAYTSNKAEIKKYLLEDGDILFNRTNSPELVGKSALYGGEREAIFAGYLIRIKCRKIVLPAYLTYCLNSPAGRAYCWRVKTDGVSQSNINAKKLAAFSFMLPSVEEQQEIVSKTRAYLLWLDNILAQVKRGENMLGRFDRSLLAKAFSGQLIDTAACKFRLKMAAAE